MTEYPSNRMPVTDYQLKAIASLNQPQQPTRPSAIMKTSASEPQVVVQDKSLLEANLCIQQSQFVQQHPKRSTMETDHFTLPPMKRPK